MTKISNTIRYFEELSKNFPEIKKLNNIETRGTSPSCLASPAVIKDRNARGEITPRAPSPANSSWLAEKEDSVAPEDVSFDGWGVVICPSPTFSNSSWGSVISRTSSHEFTDLSGWESDDDDLWMPDYFVTDDDEIDYPVKNRSLFIDEDTRWRLNELRRNPGWHKEKDDSRQKVDEVGMWTTGGGSVWRPKRMYVPVEVSFSEVDYETKCTRMEQTPLSPRTKSSLGEETTSDDESRTEFLFDKCRALDRKT